MLINVGSISVDVKLNFIFEYFEGEFFDVFNQIFPNVYSSEANVEFAIVYC